VGAVGMPLKRRTLKSCPNIGAVTGILLTIPIRSVSNKLAPRLNQEILLTNDILRSLSFGCEVIDVLEGKIKIRT
jgi:hypothetical protein